MAQYKDEKRGTWYYEYRAYGKKKKGRGYPTKKAAAQAERERREKESLEQQAYLSTVVKERADTLIVRGSESSARRLTELYNSCINPNIENKLMNEYTAGDIDRMIINAQKANKTAKTINLALNHLRTVFAHAQTHGYCQKNILSGYRRLPVQTEEMKIWTQQEFDSAMEYETDPEYKTFFELLFWTGMRKGEARCLTWNDIDMKSGKISITKHMDQFGKVLKSRKNHKDLAITVDPDTLKLLAGLKKAKMEYIGVTEDSLVFGWGTPQDKCKKPLPPETIRFHLRKCAKEAGITSIRVHDLRHSHVSWLFNNTDLTVQQIASRIGDSTSMVLKTYAHLYENNDEIVSTAIKKAKR